MISIVPSTSAQALAIFAEETHSKLNGLVASSFQVLEGNDPRPHAKRVQREEVCKAILKEESIQLITWKAVQDQLMK